MSTKDTIRALAKQSQKTQKMLNLTQILTKMLNLIHKLFKSAGNAKTEPKNTKKCLT